MAGIGQLGSSAAACCVAGALALHVVVAGVALSAPHDKKVLLPTGGGAPVMHTRLLSLSSAVAPPSAPSPSPRGVSDRTVESSTAPVATAPAEVPSSRPLPAPTPLATADSAPSPQPSSQPPLDEYLPRDLLTQAPSASQPILLDFPADLPDEQRLSIVLRLYVDEQGVVRRVARVGGDTQEQAQTIAEQAFLQARFNPGEVEGHPVKSIIHVEVTFDSTSLASSH